MSHDEDGFGVPFNYVTKDGLDGKTGLVTVLLGGKQDWKCPVTLLATCCGFKSLKVILIDSDFRAYPVLNPLDLVFFFDESLSSLSRLG